MRADNTAVLGQPFVMFRDWLGLCSRRTVEAAVAKLREEGTYRLVAEADGAYLFRRAGS